MTTDSYRRVARFYDKLFEPLNHGLRLVGARMLPPAKGMRILDVGCGTGIHLDVYRKSSCDLYGLDSSPSMLEVANTRLGEEAELKLGDATKMPYENNTFDLVLCMLVLHEMDQSTRVGVIAEIKRTLKTGGRILLIDYHPGHARPIKGWITKQVIFLSEVAAGLTHFRNYRHFVSINELPTLIKENQLSIEQKKIVAGGNLALYLVQVA